MFLYNLLVRLYGAVILAASVKKTKAKQWVEGRRNWRARLEQQVSALAGRRKIWVHCASYGEFEQGRPLMEAIRTQYPDRALVLSFFSPSGYEAFKDWEGADLICYLPLDTRANARDFIRILQPEAVVFIKYEFWLNFLFRIRQQNIPAFLVSAVFKSHHPFFKWYGGIFRRSLATFTGLFIQDQASARLLGEIGVRNYQVCGDTRFDRVVEIRERFQPLPFFEDFCRGSQVIIAGSSWPKDEELLLEVFSRLEKRGPLKLVLAPHHVDEKNIARLELLLKSRQIDYTLYNSKTPDATAPVLVLNAMGLLSRIYHYADVAYIGGGFNSGIHNCLEPAVYLKPVVFYGGNDYHKYNEALELIGLGAAKTITGPEAAEAAISQYLAGGPELLDIRERLAAYFSEKSGSTQRVLDRMQLSGSVPV
jgi:3-deoxy-D-manno-octulosonic-acid transferase